MSSATHSINIAIVGGGFAGLSLLIGVQKYPHINVHIYEAKQNFSEIGAGVILGPNSQHAMSLIDPCILEGYNRRATFTDGEPDKDGLYTWGKFEKGQEPDLHGKVLEIKHKLKSSTMHRAHFLEELVTLVKPEHTHFGKGVASVSEKGPNEPLILHFQDGTNAEADIVIGADGIHSTIRKHILGEHHHAATAMFTGAVEYRTVVPMEVAIAKLGNIRSSNDMLKCGKDGMVFGFPLSNMTQFYVTATLFDTGSWKQDEWIIPADVSGLSDRFGGYEEYVRKLVELFPNDGSTLGWSLWQMPPAPTYFKGRVAMIGDAAHASTPFQGAGAGQAFEDVLVLEQLLGRCLEPTIGGGNSPLDPFVVTELVFQAYDTVRRYRSQKIVTTSHEVARIYTGNEPGVGERAADIRERLKDSQDWIWNCNQEQQVKDALQLFEASYAGATRVADGRQ